MCEVWPSVWQVLIKLSPIRIDLSYIQLYIHWAYQRNWLELCHHLLFQKDQAVLCLWFWAAQTRELKLLTSCVSGSLEKCSHGEDSSRQAPWPGVGFCHDMSPFCTCVVMGPRRSQRFSGWEKDTMEKWDDDKIWLHICTYISFIKPWCSCLGKFCVNKLFAFMLPCVLLKLEHTSWRIETSAVLCAHQIVEVVMFPHKLPFKVISHFKHFKPLLTNSTVKSGSKRKKKMYVNF